MHVWRSSSFSVTEEEPECNEIEKLWNVKDTSQSQIHDFLLVKNWVLPYAETLECIEGTDSDTSKNDNLD
jgi:hypothetical protein